MANAPSRELRYFVRSPDGVAIHGFETVAGAETAALAHGEGALVVDTCAQTYCPMLHRVRDGALEIAGVGGWGADRMGLDGDLIEAIRKGHVAIVHAFLAKGSDVNARDAGGGPALHWAVGGGKAEIVRLLLAHGAYTAAVDGNGQTARAVAEKLGRPALVALLG